jgi:ABC-type Fe3+/spermidine/putrescine transport system ATPase subunit
MTGLSASGIEVSGLSKWFGEYHAVKEIGFSVPEGEVLALLGPSGCGKTTTLRMIAGLETASAGRIAIAGTDVYSSEKRINVPSEKRGVGLVFQSYALWPHLTVGQNVAYGLKVLGLGRQEREKKTLEMLKAVDLSGFEDRYPGSLSGGQQQRVALARSLVMEPRVLLFDEPLSNLDSKLRESMRRELRKLVMRIGLTAVYVTHDQSEAMVIADRIILMNEGRIEQSGAPKEIYLRPQTPFAANFIGSANFFEAEVVAESGAGVEIELAPGMRLKALAPAGPNPAGGSRVRVAVRPERIAMRVAAGQNDVLPGRITDAEFLGGFTSYLVSCGPVALEVQSRDPDLAVGQEVGLAIAEQDLICWWSDAKAPLPGQ